MAIIVALSVPLDVISRT